MYLLTGNDYRDRWPICHNINRDFSIPGGQQLFSSRKEEERNRKEMSFPDSLALALAKGVWPSGGLFIFMHLFCQSKAIFSKILDRFIGGYKRWFSNPSFQPASCSKLWSFSSLRCGLGQVLYVLEKEPQAARIKLVPSLLNFLPTWISTADMG